ncbi:P-type ATPase (P-ATPase) Superfamily, partial [Thraustotheca clavata]
MALVVGDLIRLVETPKERASGALAALGGVLGVANALDVDLNYGLDGTDFDAREQRYGKNYIEPEKPDSIFQLMMNAFQDLTIVVLTVAGLISLVLGLTINPTEHGQVNTEWIEGASIMFAVFLVITVTALNDYQKDKQFRSLNAVKEDEKIKVIRHGTPCEVSKFNLLVGDIVRVEMGDIIPADGIVFDANDLKLDESTMTGEIALLKKNTTNDPFLLSGTKVMEGVGKMLVICVGEFSQAGIISKLILGKKSTPLHNEPAKSTKDDLVNENTPFIFDTKDAEVPNAKKHVQVEEDVVSPLQGKLDRLTLLIGKIGLATALFVISTLVIRFSIKTFYY